MKIRKLSTGISLVLLFILVVAVQADYYIYTYRESGGPTLGSWFEYSGTASSMLGGNVAITTSGTMVLDNRTSLSSNPTTISFAAGACGDPSPPCKSQY
jgi:hypothetical protein